MHGTQDLLGHLDRIGFVGGYRVAILVGNRSHNSTRHFKLVGGVSQRLVLARIHLIEDGCCNPPL
jgi:hypothetical protein